MRVNGNGIVKSTVEDDSWGSDTCRFDYGSISGLSKEIVVTVLLSSGLEQCSKVIRGRGNARNSNDLVSLFEFLNIGGGDFGDCWKRLSVGGESNGDAESKYSNNVLGHVADDAVCLSGTSIVGGLSIPENFQSAKNPIINGENNCLGEWSSRISLNTVCLAQVGLVNAVHFGEFDTLFFEGSCCFLVVRSKRLAVPAPSVEGNESR